MSSSNSISFDYVIELAKQLSALEKVKLIEQVIPDLETLLRDSSSKIPSLRSAYGRLEDHVPAPSEGDIEETRREMFKDFPRKGL